LRYRSPDGIGATVGAGAQWNVVRVDVAGALPAGGRLEGRAWRAWSIGLSTGPTVAPVRGPGYRWELGAAAVLEYVRLRVDGDGADRTGDAWSGGLALTSGLDVETGPLLVGLGVQGLWFPAGLEVEAPDGPLGRFQRWGSTIQVRLGWRP
jgi:hypothetical protein